MERPPVIRSCKNICYENKQLTKSNLQNYYSLQNANVILYQYRGHYLKIHFEANGPQIAKVTQRKNANTKYITILNFRL